MKNQEHKIRKLLRMKYNLFHADLIAAAILDDSINVEAFERGIATIERAEVEDVDGFIPTCFRNLVTP